jgi:hypothetical protein
LGFTGEPQTTNGECGTADGEPRTKWSELSFPNDQKTPPREILYINKQLGSVPNSKIDSERASGRLLHITVLKTGG